MADIAPDHLADRLFESGDPPLVVDIRPPDEYADWHIPDSRNVPIFDALTADPAVARDALAALPEDREIVTVCAAGNRSARATALLAELGYDAMTLIDGLRGWSRVHRHAALAVPIAGTLIQVARPGKGCLSYVLVSAGMAAVVDASPYHGVYEDLIAAHDAELVAVFDTHAHADHVSGGPALAERHAVPYYLHPADAHGREVVPLVDGRTVPVGDLGLEVLHTPGHSPGSVTYAVEDAALLTGDTLFHESVGRVELGVAAGTEDADVAANAAALYGSLQRLLARPGDPLVLPAHDPGTPDPPVTASLRAVEHRNPELDRDREPFIEALAGDVPDHPPNFQRVKRVNVGVETVADEEVAGLELGPNRCAAE